MSLIYNKEFTSSAPIESEVKEMLYSYFSSGLLNDTLFSRWIEHCLRKLRKSSLKVKEACIELCDYTACLPEDFDSIREVWATSRIQSNLAPEPTYQYYQKDCRVTTIYDPCNECAGQTDCTTTLPSAGCEKQFRVTHRISGYWYYDFEVTHLLSPGNINARGHCGQSCANMFASSDDTFDIQNGKIITNFREGLLYLQYYAPALDEEDQQMIPKDYWVEDFIRKYLLFKCYEMVANNTSDESYRIVESKRQQYEQQSIEAFVAAETQLKMEDLPTKLRKIKEQKERYRKGYWNIK